MQEAAPPARPPARGWPCPVLHLGVHCGHVSTCAQPTLRLLQVCSLLSPGKGHAAGRDTCSSLPQHRGLSSKGEPTKCKLPSLLFLGDGGLNFHIKRFFIFPSKGERTVNSSVPAAITNTWSVLYTFRAAVLKANPKRRIVSSVSYT